MLVESLRGTGKALAALLVTLSSGCDGRVGSKSGGVDEKGSFVSVVLYQSLPSVRHVHCIVAPEDSLAQ